MVIPEVSDKLRMITVEQRPLARDTSHMVTARALQEEEVFHHQEYIPGEEVDHHPSEEDTLMGEDHHRQEVISRLPPLHQEASQSSL